MRVYMDNYFANDPEYMKLDDAGRDAFVARYNVQRRYNRYHESK